MSHANFLASSSPSGACVHMRKEIFALQDEDWASYGDALRVLADKAYSDLEEKAHERLALTQFLAHIGNPQVAFGVRQKRPETVEAAVVATIDLESYLNSCSSRVQGGATPVASAATSNSTESISEALQQLNERLDKLEVLVVSKETKTNTRKRERESESRRPTCWNCGKKGHIARKCWNRQKQQGQGNSKPSAAWACHEGEDT